MVCLIHEDRMGWKIKNISYVLVFIVIILLEIPSVYSVCIGEGTSVGSNMDACLTVSPKTVSGRGPSSTSISGEVENKNWICTISCSYRTSQGKSGSIGSIPAGDSKSFTMPIDIPTSGSSPQTISIYADCSGSGGWGCGYSDSIPESVTLTYTYCGDGAVNGGETCSNCQADAGCQSGYVCQNGQCIERCGNGVQDSGETCSSCPADVKCIPGVTRCENAQCVTYCGNYQKDSGETCSSCPTDVQCQSGYICKSGECVKEIRCGDGQCQAIESCSSCPSDCGKCPPVCGDGACEGDESCSTCAKDCGKCAPICGNGQCESGETCSSCSSDCGACPKKSTPQVTSGEATSDKSIQQQGIQKGSSTSLATTQEATQQPNQPATTLTILGNNKKSVIAILSIVVLGVIAWIVYKIISKRKHKKIHHHEGEEKHKLKHCTKCGSKGSIDDVYCEKCGKKL